MNNNIIPNKATNETKIYRAGFDRYIQTGHRGVSLKFTEVQDERGNFIKKSFIASSSQASHLIGKLLPEQQISFSAEVVTGEDYPDGFDLINVSFSGLN